MKPRASPLAWPPAFPRTNSRERGRFRVSLNKAIDNVERSLRLFGRDSRVPVGSVVISSNVQPLSRRQPEDPGIAVWFSWDGEQRCIPVDRFTTIEANLQAVHKIVEARRIELRLGGITMARATFTGFKALPAEKGWRSVLNFAPDARPGKQQVDTRFRQLALERHPDQGGTDAAFAELKQAHAAATREIGQ